jgi:hypothetical protein
MIATFPLGGVAWDYGQYVLGLEELGFDVVYLEDTGDLAYDPVGRTIAEECSYAVKFLKESLTALSPRMSDRWHYRAASGETFGMSQEALCSAVAEADIFLNISGGTILRNEYLECPRKVLIDTDPGWNHFVVFPKWDTQGGWEGVTTYREHDYFFTYAEQMGAADCLLPDLGITWHPTRPPVVLDRWQPNGEGTTWTTVMSWKNYRKPIEYHNRTFGAKELEFPKIVALPGELPGLQMEVAVGGPDPPIEDWRQQGWRVKDSHLVSVTLDAYRHYIECSRGELSVAKNVYVATYSGWFSCRSACYLASARPVVLQDTGFSELIPTGQGLFAYSDQDEAKEAILAIEADYSRHSRTARDLAAELFNPRLVIGGILKRVGL